MRDCEIALWTTDFLPDGHEIIGVVEGSVLVCRNTLREMTAEAKNLAGIEATSWLTEARKQAVGALLGEAQRLGACAVIGLRYDFYHVSDTLCEALAYGTAIRLCAHKERLDSPLEATSMENHARIDLVARLEQLNTKKD